MKLGLISVIFIFNFAAGTLLADSNFDQITRDFLTKFKQSPKDMINAPLFKRDANGDVITNLISYPKDSEEFKKVDKTMKKKINADIFGEGKEGWTPHDSPYRLFTADYQVETNLKNLKTKAELTTVPWSADYWAIALGMTAYRYADSELQDLVQDDYSEFQKVKFATVNTYKPQPADYLALEGLSEEDRNKAIDLYSPAEKYDLLMGDFKFSLTNASKKEGLSFLDEDGFVEMWMGICHGWAPAAYMYKRPVKPLTLTAADGITEITFYEDDIKALASLKWAKSPYNSRFVGGRCNLKGDDVKTDEKTGKILNKECFDTNPGTWHISVANKIGIQNESFVMDATFDYEVWNQPVQAYEVSFFNVADMSTYDTMEEAVTNLAELGEADTFHAVRNADPRATQVVGVSMKVVYISETRPRQGEPRPDRLVNVYYQYDLELDDNFNIVGGEWYTNNHPDFLWTPYENQQPMNNVDRQLARPLSPYPFDGDLPWLDSLLNNQLARASAISVQYDNSPLKYVIDGLIELSSQEEEAPLEEEEDEFNWDDYMF